VYRPRLTLHVFILAALIALRAVPAFGQLVENDRPAPATLVTATASARQVRFVSLGEVRRMRLEIFSEDGTQLSGVKWTSGNLLDWRLQDSQGQRLADGSYLFLISVQDFSQGVSRKYGMVAVQSGQVYLQQVGLNQLSVQEAEALGVHRGVERPGPVDRIGVEVAGTSPSATADSSDGEPESSTDSSSDAAETGEEAVTPSATGSGTAGNIAKWTTSTALGNSVMRESGGKIGLGTSSPVSKLHVLSAATQLLPPRLQSSGTTSFAAGWDFYHGTLGKGYVGVPGSGVGYPAPGEMLVYGATGVKTSLWAGGVRSMTIDTAGAVGIGTATPLVKLDVAGSAGNGVRGISTGGGRGVWGESSTWQGVFGRSSWNAGVAGASYLGTGVYGETSAYNTVAQAGVYGKGWGSGGIGVLGEANVNNAVGVLGLSASAQGVALYARNTGGGYGIYSEGNVAQNLNRGGLVKAMIYVHSSGAIYRCYNGAANSSGGNCGFTIDALGGYGVFRINLGFRVDDRFVSVTAQYGPGNRQANNMGANFKFINSTTIDIITFDANGGEDSYPWSFMLIVY